MAVVRALAAFGLVFVVACLALGFSPVRTSGAACGSAFRPDNQAVDVARYFNALAIDGGNRIPLRAVPGCDGARSPRRILAIVFGVAGLGALAAAGAARTKRPEPATGG
jgi:hypothetical protein